MVDEFIPHISLLLLSERVAGPRGSQKIRVIAGLPQCFKLADQQIQPFEVEANSDLGVLGISEFVGKLAKCSLGGEW